MRKICLLLRILFTGLAARAGDNSKTFLNFPIHACNLLKFSPFSTKQLLHIPLVYCTPVIAYGRIQVFNLSPIFFDIIRFSI